MIKKGIFLITLLITIHAQALITVSIAPGQVDDPLTWNNGVPGILDTAIVAHALTDTSTHVVQALIIQNGASLTTIKTFTIKTFCDIQTGALLTNNGTLIAQGNYFLNGTASGSGVIRLSGLSGNLIGGTGLCNNTAQISITSNNRTIQVGTNLDWSAMKVVLFNSITVTNNGIITISDLKGKSTGETWVNSSNSQLLITDQLRNDLLLDASANPNLVSYGHSNSLTTSLLATVTGEYHDLEVVGNGKRQLEGNITINNDFTIGGTAIMDVENGASVYDVTILGNWNNTGGSFDAATGSVTFAGSGNQNLTISSGSEGFYNLNLINTDTLTQSGNITVVNDLTFTATYDLNGSTIQLLGDFVNDGPFLSNGGTVNMSGFSTQAISNEVTFDNLVANNIIGVDILSGFTTIYGTLSLNNGSFSTNDSLIIGSNASQTGRIGEVTFGSINGDVTVERYFDPVQSWMMLGAPTNGLTLADWNDEFYMTGFTGSDLPSYWFNSVQFYDETQLGHKDNGLNGATDITNSVPVGTGIRLFTNSLPITIESTGTVHTGSFNFSLTYTDSGSPLDDGWNLMGNPYVSAIDWDGSGWTKTNVNDAIYVWDGILGLYNSYIDGVGVNGGSNIIPSSQSFWVQTNASSPVLSITESDKSVSNGVFKNSGNQSVFNLYISNGDYQDQIAIVVKDGATMNYDNQYDAVKFYTPNTYIPNIASVSEDDVELAINSIPMFDAETSIPIKVVAEPGTHSIETDTDLGLLPTSCATLEDLFTGDTMPITADMSYDFDWSGGNMISPRFLIHFTPPAEMSVVDLTCTDSDDGSAEVIGTADGPWNYTWYDDAGNVIQETLNSMNSDDISDLAAGYYSVLIEGGNECGNSVIEFEILNVIPSMFEIVESTVDQCNSSSDGSVSYSVFNEDEALTWEVELVDSQNNIVYSTTSGTGDFEITDLNAEEYTLTVSNDCELFVENISLFDPDAVTASFEVSSEVINLAIGEDLSVVNNSINANSYLWDFGDGNQSADVEPEHMYAEVGVYTVILIASNDFCDHTIEIEIEVIDQPVGIEELDPSQFNVYFLNTNELVIETDYSVNENVTIEVINYIGQSIYNKQVNSFNGYTKVLLPEISKSIYLISMVKDGETLFTKKLIH